MNIRKVLLTAVLAAAAAAAASAANMKIVSFTGKITIKTKAGKVIALKAGDKAPAIKAGDTVTVDEGQATLKVNGDTVSAGAGSSFSWGGKVLSVTAGSVSVTSRAGTQTFGAGQTATVTPPASAPSQPTVSNLVPQAPPQQQQQTVSPSAP